MSSLYIKGTVYSKEGKYANKNPITHREDTIDMELHDAIDYIILKYVSKGSKFQAMFARITTEMSREQERTEEQKTL